MTADEAKTKADMLGTLNLGIWNAKTSYEQKQLRKQMTVIWRELLNAGFKILKCKAYDNNGNRIPKFKIYDDGSEKYVSIVDNRGNGYHKGDCTTRCISFCTGVDYETIQKEQFAYAKKYGSCWRTCSVWSKSLTTRGFSEIVLPKHISRKVFLKKFEDCGIDEGVIATKSSGHLAAIDMKTKKILDLFNSAGGRIKTIYVPNSMKDVWTKKINAILG
jgi:hypothetical protein